MPRSPCIGSALLSAAVVTLLSGAATAAQDLREGIRAGSFVLSPSVTVGTTYDSNLFRLPPPRTDTVRVSLSPELLIASDWNRHAAKVEAGVDAGFYANSGNDNYLDAWLGLAGELDVTRRFRLNLAAGAVRGHDPRSSREIPAGAAEPVRFAALDLQLGAEAEFGRLRLAPYAAWRRFDFRDVPLIGGGTARQDNRDRREAEAGVELGYAPGRGWEMVFRAGVLDIDYSDNGSTAGPARDASGMTALAGVRLAMTRLVEGRLTAGIVRHDYASPAFADITTLAVDAGIDWHPTRRLLVRAEAGRSVVETALPGASGSVTTTAALRADYELLRTLVLGAGGWLAHDGYNGITRSDLDMSIGVAADWSPVSGITIRPDYRFTQVRSDAPGQDYTAHVFSVSATYRMGARK